VTRAELVVRMARASGWSKAATERAMKSMLAGMLAALKRGEPVTLVGFGTLTAARRKPRTIANPRTGKKITVSGRVPRFRPSKELKQAVR
jgi:nucleoid DNA-binding protein